VAGNGAYTSGGTFQKIIRFVNANRATGLGGWIVKIRPDHPAEIDALLDRAAYEALIGSQPH
jgi:glycine cleavage system H lipoate-binding protein